MNTFQPGDKVRGLVNKDLMGFVVASRDTEGYVAIAETSGKLSIWPEHALTLAGKAQTIPERSIMEGHNTAEEQLGVANSANTSPRYEVNFSVREKHWGELTDGEKIERLRSIIKALQDRIGEAVDVIHVLEGHEHATSGKPVVEVRRLNQYSGVAGIGPTSGDVWF